MTTKKRACLFASSFLSAFSKLLKIIYFRFNEDDVLALGAQLTFNLILAFFPFLFFLLTLISYTPLTREEVLVDLSRILPASAYNIVKDIIKQTSGARSGTLLSFGMIASVWVASNGALAVIKGINKAYDCKETRPFWKTRGMSLLFTIALAIVITLMLVTFVFGEIVSQIVSEYVFQRLGFLYTFKAIEAILRFATSVVFLILVFMLTYKFMPNCRLKLREVIPGSVFAAAGWLITSSALSFFINKFANLSFMYGSIGGIIALLLWLYWSSIIILIGGEINAVLTLNN